jgi:hypothetical protein
MPNKTILDYLKQNNISDTTKFSLQDDGEGVYIKDWGYLLQKPTLPSPEATELRALKSKKINECKAYLASTDWQIIRLSDPTSGESLKEGVAEKRVLARSAQNDIETGVINTLEDLNNINFE